MPMVMLMIVHTVKRNIFRLRASDADDDYPLKFSIQGKTNPYFIAQAAGSLQNSLSVQEQHKLAFFFIMVYLSIFNLALDISKGRHYFSNACFFWTNFLT